MKLKCLIIIFCATKYFLTFLATRLVAGFVTTGFEVEAKLIEVIQRKVVSVVVRVRFYFFRTLHNFSLNTVFTIPHSRLLPNQSVFLKVFHSVRSEECNL